MADELTIISELGEDADLLMAPDDWLENQRLALQQNMSMLADQLHGVLVAQRIKRQLQQRNLVAIRCVEKSGGAPSDIIIKVCPVTDALERLASERNDPGIPIDVSEESARQQIDTWRLDGYDIDTAERLNRRKRKHG